MKRLLYSAVALVGLASAANASFVQVSTLPPGPYFSPHPDSSTNTFVDLKLSVTDVYKSPFDTTPEYGTAEYTSVQGNGSAIFNVSGYNASLIWGSPDYYNHLSLYTGIDGSGTKIEEIDGSSIVPGDGTHFSFVSIKEITEFKSIVFANKPGINAFEFSTLVTSVPLPASLPMFGGAILALAGFSFGLNRWVAPKGKSRAVSA